MFNLLAQYKATFDVKIPLSLADLHRFQFQVTGTRFSWDFQLIFREDSGDFNGQRRLFE